MRLLTGRFFLESRFFGGYNVMVEVTRRDEDEHDGSLGPEYNIFEKAKHSDILTLGIYAV